MKQSQQHSLFEESGEDTRPLADRMRPTSLDEVVGQSHQIGQGKALRSMIEADRTPSMIFWGPPGVGKTTLARVIARHTHASFIDFSAVTSGIKEIREVMKQADAQASMGRRTIVFVDEIHRFNKAQQDAFLPFVEKGSIILIGATTENPSFEVNNALLSRCKVFVLNALDEDDIAALLRRALADPRGFGDREVRIEDDLLRAIATFANGDARVALSTLEMVVLNGVEDGGVTTVGPETVRQLTSTKSLRYDKDGEEHYNIISALHKSMRNSDPDAAVYWLARMLEGGEDPLYVARRITRFASGPGGHERPERGDQRLPGRPLHRYARVLGPLGAGRHLPVAGSQVEQLLRRLRAREEGRAAHARRTRAAGHPQRADPAHEGPGIRARLPAGTLRGRQGGRRHAVPARFPRGRRVLQAHRGGQREALQRAARVAQGHPKQGESRERESTRGTLEGDGNAYPLLPC